MAIQYDAEAVADLQLFARAMGGDDTRAIAALGNARDIERLGPANVEFLATSREALRVALSELAWLTARDSGNSAAS